MAASSSLSAGDVVYFSSVEGYQQLSAGKHDVRPIGAPRSAVVAMDSPSLHEALV